MVGFGTLRRSAVSLWRLVFGRVFAVVAALVVGASSLGAVPLSQVAHAEGLYNLSGIVTNQSGQGIGDVSVSATESGGGTIVAGPVVTAANGAYSLPIDLGIYDIHFIPTQQSGYNQIVQSGVTVAGNQTINVQLTPATHTYAGTLTDQNGAPIPGAEIRIQNNNRLLYGPTDANGHFSIAAPAEAYAQTYVVRNFPNGSFYMVQANEGPNLSGGDVSQDLRVHLSALTVVTKDGEGNTLAGVQVSSGPNGSGSTTSQHSLVAGSMGVSQVRASITGVTGGDGSYTMMVPTGTSFSSNIIYAQIPGAGTVYLASTVTVSNGVTVEISAPSTHVYSGTLADQNGTPIPGAEIRIQNDNRLLYGPTDQNGNFSISAPAEAYTQIYAVRNFPNGSFYMVQSPSGPDLRGGNVTQGLRVRLVDLTIATNDAAGNPLVGVPVSSSPNGSGASSSPDSLVLGTSSPSTVRASIVGTTGADGTYTMKVPDKVTFSPNTIYAQMPNVGVVNLATQLVVNGNTAAVISAPAVTYTYTGTLRDQNGTPIPGAEIRIQNNNRLLYGPTDANGHFSIVAPAEAYTDVYAVRNLPNGAFYVVRSSDGPNLSSGNVSQDLNLHLSPLTIVTKDADGNPLPGISVSSGPNGSEFAISAHALVAGTSAPSQVKGSIGGVTGPDGSYTMFLPTDVAFAGNTIYAQFPDTGTVYVTSPVTMGGMATVLLQQTRPTPPAPTNLAASSPTELPVSLTWTGVTGAAEYYVYRDGEQIGTSLNATYEDTSAVAGSHTYYVTAVNSGGESPQSNAVTVVVVVNQPPVISLLQGRTIELGGSYSDNGTFSDLDSTLWTATVGYGDGSGAQLLPLAGYGFSLGHVYADPGTYTVTVAVTDEHGASSSVSAEIVIQDTLAPVVTGQPDRQPDNNGWYSSPVTISWSVADNDEHATIPVPTPVTTEGRDQQVSSTQSCDTSNNCANGVYELSLDSTAPAVTGIAASTSTKPTTGTSTFTATVSDALSGIAGGEYFLGDTDPGIGHGATLVPGNQQVDSSGAVTSATLSATFGSDFPTGVYKVTFRAIDTAGNWSATTSDYLVVYDPAGPKFTGKRTVTPSLANGDVLPGLASSGQTDLARFGFSVKYNNLGQISNNSDFQFTYSTGTHCNNPNKAVNCHNFVLNANDIAWLTTSGVNNSTGIFQGVAQVQIDGQAPQSLLFRVTGRDGERLSPTGIDQFQLSVFEQGADPNAATPVYRVNMADIGRGNIKISN